MIQITVQLNSFLFDMDKNEALDKLEQKRAIGGSIYPFLDPDAVNDITAFDYETLSKPEGERGSYAVWNYEVDEVPIIEGEKPKKITPTTKETKKSKDE